MSKKDTEKKLKQFSVKGIKEVLSGSNRVFLCEMVDESSEKKILSIYKPIKGERPLRDFFVGNCTLRLRIGVFPLGILPFCIVM